MEQPPSGAAEQFNDSTGFLWLNIDQAITVTSFVYEKH
jgi:hypothetical protein